MITNESIKGLVKSLRGIAKRNTEERDRYKGEYWKGQSDGRTSAYSLAADWLEQIIHEEVDDEHR